MTFGRASVSEYLASGASSSTPYCRNGFKVWFEKPVAGHANLSRYKPIEEERGPEAEA